MFDRVEVKASDKEKVLTEKEIDEFKDFLTGYFNESTDYAELLNEVQKYKSQQTKTKDLLLSCLNKIMSTENWGLARNIIIEFGGRNPKDDEKLKYIVRTIISGLTEKNNQ